jgi:hypothetical protein
VFASDEEALAAAEEAYQRYEVETNRAGQDGWMDTSGYPEFLAGDALTEELEGASELAAKGFRQIGDATHDSTALQQVRENGSGAVDIVIYLCSDVSNVDVVNREGVSVTSSDRPSRQALEVEAIGVNTNLKIERIDTWSGTGFC